MSIVRDRDDQVLSTWLGQGVDAAPPSAVRAALEQVASTRQRRELAIVRRFYNVETTAVLNRRPAFRLAVLGVAGLLLVVGLVAALRFVASPDVTPAATPSRSSMLLSGLPAPAGTVGSPAAIDDEAIRALTTTARDQAFQGLTLAGPTDAAAVLFVADVAGDSREFAVAAVAFRNVAAATAAMAQVQRDLGSVPDAVGMWEAGNSPFTDEHLPAGRDAGFERSGTYLAFGGTSANASNRAGHVNVWRVGDVVFVAIGVDWITVGTADSQAAIELGVVALSNEITSRALQP